MLDKKETIEKKKRGIFATTMTAALVVIVLIAGILLLLRALGKRNLTTSIASVEAADAADGQGQEGTAEGQVLYKGKLYERNNDLITILVMGIDKETVTTIGGQSWTTEEGSFYSGGQADALFLALLNPHTKAVNVIAVNRNSMADIDTWDKEGNYKGVWQAQIALQHGYGYGDEESCLRQVKAVSRMFHNIPINSYVAVSMDAIPELNDALGGVTVDVLDDIVYPEYDMDLHTGETVTLHGEKAYWYVRLRNENIFNSNELRLNRQKQYLTAFALKAKEQALSDIRVVLDLYNTINRYMVTDMDLSSFTYLATEMVNYEFDTENIYTLKGETIQGERFEEFYVDDDALQDMIMDLFYEPVAEG